MRIHHVFLVATLAGFGCGTSSTQGDSVEVQPPATNDMAPAHIVIAGQYSDARFLDAMAAHHQAAINMANVAKTKAEHDEIRQMAANIVASQSAEIDTMRSMMSALSGSPRVTLTMNPVTMENDGVPDSIADAKPFDLAFLDAMIPHHAGAIRMASVARMHSADAKVRALARSIIDAQSKEIGEMIGWRGAWYPDAP